MRRPPREQRCAAEAAGAVLEREDEVAALDRAVAALRAGEGGLVLVEGEPGIGKTTLLDHVLREAGNAGVDVLATRAAEHDRTPGGVVRDLVGAADGRAAEVLRCAVEARCARGPLLLAADDLQWSDETSLAALAALAARASARPVLLVLAARTGSAVPVVLDQALRSPGAAELRPAPLSATAVQRLSGGSEGFAATLRRQTGGVPFLVHAVLGAVTSRTDEDVGALRAAAPPAVLRALRARLQALGPEAGRLAEACAVLDGPAAPAFAAAVAGLDAAACDRAVVALAAAHVVADGDELDLLHPLLRTVLRAGTAPRDRSALHARAAVVLAEDGAPPGVVATQLLRTSPSRRAEVARTLHEAGVEALAEGAVQTALPLLDRALREPPAPGDRGAVLADLGWAARIAGREDAGTLLHAAWDAAEDPRLKATIVGRLGEVAVLDGTASATDAELVEVALDALDPYDEDRLLLLARLYYVNDRRTGSGQVSRAFARRIPHDLDGATAGRRACLVVLAAEAADFGHVDEVRALLDRAGCDGRLRDVDRADWPLYAMQGAAYIRLTGRLGQAAALWEAIATHAGATGRDDVVGVAQANLASILLRLGAGREAQDAAEAALLTGMAVRDTYGGAVVRAHVGRVRVEQDAAAEALVLLGGRPRSPGHGGMLESAALAAAHAARGELEQAAALQQPLGEEWLAFSGRHVPAVSEWGPDAAVALAAVGRTEEARAVLDDTLAAARRFGHPAVIGRVIAARGVVERAPELLREAVGLLEPTEHRLEHLRAVVDLGTVLRRVGHDREARTHLRAGLDLARERGLALLARRARDELLAAGGRAVDRPRHGPAGLTPAEDRVARLAAEGCSNRAIAQRLFVTPRTVEMHLGNAYRKLGIASRRELATVLAGAAL